MKNVLIGIAVVFVILLGVVATRPNTYHVERSATIAAPPQAVYPMIEDFHQWKHWSPWEKIDPAMKTDFSGPESGVGASYHWAGNDEVGEGRMTITDVRPVSEIAIKLEFLKPWQATNACKFTIDSVGDSTKVTWAMDGNHNFISKAMGMFMPMAKMIGPDFEKGLASMKSLAEASAPAAPADTTAVAPAS